LWRIDDKQVKSALSIPLYCVANVASLVVRIHNPPDLNRFDEIINLLFLLNYSIMGHPLYLPFHANNSRITDSMWAAWSHEKKLAISILNYIGNHYTIHMENQEVDFSIIAYSFLSHQIRCLVRNANSSLSDSLMESIAVHFSESNSDLAEFISAHHYFQRSTDSYDWYDQSPYTVLTSQKHPSGEFEIFLFSIKLMCM